MTRNIFPSGDFVELKKNPQFPNIYDVELNQIDYLRNFQTVECHLVLYPYSRKVCSRHIAFYPFEEYIKDILSHQKSAYIELKSHFNNIFGILLGALITFIFFQFKPTELFSIESIMSILGAYFVGKDIWDEIETFLINLTKHWRVSYHQDYYSFVLDKHTTLTRYSHFAKKQRYGSTSLLPEKIDFIQQSNSQTVRMCFNMQDLPVSITSTAHILSIHIEPAHMKDFEAAGFMFGVKLSLNKRFFGIERHLELFQSLHNYTKGALDEQSEWRPESIFFRQTLAFGRLKLFLKKGIMPAKTILECTCPARPEEVAMAASSAA